MWKSKKVKILRQPSGKYSAEKSRGDGEKQGGSKTEVLSS